MTTISQLESQLNDFSEPWRRQAFQELLQQVNAPTPSQEIFNLHCHTFHSFNAFGYSPAALVWLARQRGFSAIGLVDFDVLDGVDEFLWACELAGVRGCAAIETRAYLPEFGQREINSPGEPGIVYHMGIGFTQSAAPTEVAATLQGMRLRSEKRNRAMTDRLNAFLQPVTVDYEAQVLPLTPRGNATERHLLKAYIEAAQRAFGARQPEHMATFWAEKLGISLDEARSQMDDYARFSNTIRGKLMKRGGVAYIPPTPASFPSVDEVNRFIVACRALPCVAWLDGTSEGEQAPEELLHLHITKGAAALNIIPDRNWNIADPDQRRKKVQNLYQVVALAKELNLPIVVGTEMNAPGQKIVDEFDAPELVPLKDVFLDGMYFIYGHTVMERALGLGYQSAWASQYLPGRKERIAFYAQAGRLIQPGLAGIAHLKTVEARLPDSLLAAIRQG